LQSAINKKYYAAKLLKRNLIVITLLGLILIPLNSAYLQKYHLPERSLGTIPPALQIKEISGNFKYSIADLFYIRGIMGLTESNKAKDRMHWIDWVQDYFAAALILDSQLSESFFFSGMVMGRKSKGIQKGIDFLKQYQYLAPNAWKVPYWIGFNYYQLGEYTQAVKYYNEAAQLPNAPKYLRGNIPMMYYQSGRLDMGILFMEGLIKSLPQDQLGWLSVKLQWLKDISLLEKKYKEFQQHYGYAPESLEKMVEKGFLDKIPQDPFGKGYTIDERTGKIASIFTEPVGN